MIKLLSLSAALLLIGCVPRMVMNHMDRDAYLKYRSAAEHTNLEREKAGLKPNPIMTVGEWQSSK